MVSMSNLDSFGKEFVNFPQKYKLNCKQVAIVGVYLSICCILKENKMGFYSVQLEFGPAALDLGLDSKVLFS